VIVEPLARRVEVEETRASRPVVTKAVDDPGRCGDEGALRPLDVLALGPKLENEPALEHVERIRVAAMDVRVRATLAALVARLGDRDRVQADLEADGSRVPFRDDLALAGP
jgi:hypothetical protein